METEVKLGSVVLFQAENGPALEVKLESETVWLTQEQLAVLFERDRSVISKHLKNVFEEELDRKSNVQKLHIPNSDKPVKFYNLEVIISVGYRVKSKAGTRFRLWANKILKEYLVQGYALNDSLLKEQSRRLEQLHQTVKLLSNVLESKSLTTDEATGLLQVITDFSYALKVLDDYDHQTLKIEYTSSNQIYKIGYEEAIRAIDELKTQTGGSDIFGREKDQSFKSSINTIYQSFDGADLYPSVEEKAAHLLYFVIKNHSFTDGNKRIAAFLFVWFMERNKILYTSDNRKRLADNALVALTLMIAESKPDEKEMMINVVVNLINSRND
ncbi:MAG: virulence protein RhuM/Fic/DOC family protein [Pyrinomonadaceae bacterium]|nr:virulence protein RhuM/Fic/DOC family protein [Sphingobacteriaceae bacterium]